MGGIVRDAGLSEDEFRALARNHGFSARELNVIRSYIEEHLARILEAWDEHCG